MKKFTFKGITHYFKKIYEGKEVLKKLRMPIFLLALFLFIGGIYISIQNYPIGIENLKFLPLLALLFILTPLQAILNSHEFMVSSRMQSANFTFLEAFKVTLAGSLANYLPVPGSMIAKVAALKLKGVKIKKGTVYTILSSLLLLGMVFVYAGVLICLLYQEFLGGVQALLGGAVLVFLAGFSWKEKLEISDVLPLIANRVFMVALDGCRIYFAFLTLDSAATYLQSCVLTTSSVIGLAVSIVPAGLGIKEFVAAALAPSLFLGGASVFLAVSLIRFIDIIVVSVLLATVHYFQKYSQKQNI